MLLTLLAGTGSILITWVILTAILVGIGLGLRRAFGARRLETSEVFTAFWVGFCSSLMILQIWHLLASVGIAATLILTLLGLAGLGWNRAELGTWVRQVWSGRRFAVMAALLLLAFWLANRATASPTGSYDTGMYHVPVVRWLEAFPIVPGLGNLHGRLAYNNAHLLFAAAIDVGPWAGRVYHLVSGLMFLALTSQVLLSVFRLTRTQGMARTHAVFEACLLTLLIAFIMTARMSGLATDLVPILLLFLASSLLFRLVTIPPPEPESRAYLLFATALALVTAVCAKLSAVGFAVPAWLLTVALSWRLLREYPGLRARTLTWTLAASLFLAVPWVARGVILSGYPAFPSTALGFPVEWRIVPEAGQVDAAYIKWTARHYYNKFGGISFDEPWFGSWVRHLPDRNLLLVVLPSLLVAVGLAGCLLAYLRRRPGERPVPQAWLLLIPILGALAFWFATAPNPRFGCFIFWIFAALALAQLHAARGNAAGPAAGRVMVVLALLVGSSPITAMIAGYRPDEHDRTQVTAYRIIVLPRPGEAFGPIDRGPIERYLTSSGLELNHPARNNQCWDAPLPCTPYPARNLRLRGNDLGSGFVTDGQWLGESWPFEKSRFLETWRRRQQRKSGVAGSP